MEHYLSHTDYPIWEVIQKGNGLVSVSIDTNGVIKVLPPKIAEEILARERKARTTLLMALPEDHLAKFHKMTDAKEMWDAIKSRFGGNDESKKMHKYILKQQFEGFSVSPLKIPIRSSLGLYLLPGPNSTNDVSTTYSASPSSGLDSQRENSSSYTDELMYSFFANQSSGPQLDHEDLEQLDEFDLEEMDLKWLQFDAKELSGFNKTKVECFNCHKIGHFARECRSKGNQESRRRDAGNTGYKAKDNRRRPGKQEEPKALVTLDGEGVDWTGHAEDEQENFALMAYSNSGSDTEVKSCSKECVESYTKLKKLYDEQREQLGDASIEIQAYTQALKKVEAQLVAHQKNQLWYEEKIRFMKIDLDDKTDVLTYHKKLLAEAVKEKEELKTKLENFQSSSKGLSKLLNSQMSTRDKSGLGYGNQIHEGVLSYEKEVLESVFDSRLSDVEDSPVHDRFANVEGMHAVPPPMTGNYMPPGPDREVDDSMFTYGPKQSKTSESDTQTSNFDSCESNSSVETLESVPELVVVEPKVVSQPKVWSDAPIIEEYESDSDDEYVIQPSKEQEKPSFAFVNTVKHVKTPRETVKEQNTYSPSPKSSQSTGMVELNKKKGKGTGQGENRPVWNNVQRLNHQNKFVPKAVLTKTGIFPVNTARQNLSSQAATTSTARKPFNRATTPKANFSNQKVNTAEVKAVSAVGDMRETAVKPSAGCNWRPKRHYWNKVSKYNSGSSFSKNDTLQSALKNKGIVDSGCSRHMTGNKAYLVEYQDYNGGLVTFGGSKSYITGKGPKGSREIQEWPETPQQNRTAERKNRNLTPMRSENQANKTAGLEEANHSVSTQDNIDAGYSEMEADPAQDYFVLPICSYTSTVKSLEAKNEGTARATSTNTVNTIRTPISTASPLNVFSASIPALNNNDQYDSQIPAREDIYDSPSNGIFTNASYERGAWLTSLNLETTGMKSLFPLQGYTFFILQLKFLEIQNQQFKQGAKFALWEEAIGTKWLYRNKKDERGVVVKNKARIEAIRIFLAFDSYMGFIVYQMDVNSAFLYGTIDEEVYVDDIIFGSTKRSWCDEFEALMKSRFQMSSMGELTFFLGLQVNQKEDGIFMSQDKYVAEILKKFQFTPKTHITCCEEDLLGILKAKPLWQPRKFDFCGNAKKQTIVATSLQKVELLLLHTSEDKNLVFYSKTKHIEIRHHFIRDAYEKKLIQVLKIHTDDNVADLLTKAFDSIQSYNSRYNRFVLLSLVTTAADANLRKGNYWKHGCSLGVGFYHLTINGHQFTMSNRHQELAIPEQTTSGQPATGKKSSNPLMADSLPKTIQSNDPPLSRGYTLGSGEDSLKLMELMAYCTNLCEFETAALCTMEDGVLEKLKLEDSEGLSSLLNAEIFEQLANMGEKWRSKSSIPTLRRRCDNLLEQVGQTP
ncbi:ribonuclease H-like domain-containing protein [Tanacetum coccineum]